jgi:hypothetical protein
MMFCLDRYFANLSVASSWLGEKPTFESYEAKGMGGWRGTLLTVVLSSSFG